MKDSFFYLALLFIIINSGYLGGYCYMEFVTNQPVPLDRWIIQGVGVVLGILGVVLSNKCKK